MMMNIYGFNRNILHKMLVIVLFCCPFISSAETTLSIYPSPVVAGEQSRLIINSTEGRAVIDNLPHVKGLEWLEPEVHSRSYMIINGKKYIKTTYPFIVKKPGKLTLPPMTVTLPGSEKLSTAEKEILVSTGPLSDLKNMLFLKCRYPQNKDYYYVGEDIPLIINVFRTVGFKADPIEFPKIKLDNIVFDDFKNSSGSGKFAPYPYRTPERVTYNGMDYIKTEFYTSFRPLSAGKLEGIASLVFRIGLKRKDNSRQSAFSSSFFDSGSFFSDPFDNNKYVTRIISAEIPEINVKELPPVPEKCMYLGLVGDWNLNSKVVAGKLQEGEPITLSLTVKGFGSAENLNPPEINVPGFNTYPPEVISENGRGLYRNIKIDYVLIPTESGKTNLNLAFSVFNTKSGKYRKIDINREFYIKKGKGRGVKNAFMPEKKPARKPEKNKVSNSILYINVNPGPGVDIPLYKNCLFIFLFLLIGGPILWILFELFCLRKKYITAAEGYRRKNRALKRKMYIIRKLKKSKNIKELSDTVQKEVIPYINDIKNYPPGTNVSDLEKKIEDKELVKPLHETETSAYMPGNEGNTEELKRKILKIVKHFSIFIMVFSVIFSASNSRVTAEKIKPENSNINRFTKLYNAGEFDKASKICRKQINMSAPNPGWIYNLGNCCFQKGDLPKAMVFYERALRLEPGNSDILENLNFVRRKLYLPEVYQTKTPGELVLFLRNRLRPDQWLLIFAAAWFLIFTGLILRKKTAAKIWLSICISAVAVCMISAAAYFTEMNTTYNSRQAIVVERNVKVYSLPTKESSQGALTLKPGDKVSIEERLESWARVRKDKSEGWINCRDIKEIWPYQ